MSGRGLPLASQGINTDFPSSPSTFDGPGTKTISAVRIMHFYLQRLITIFVILVQECETMKTKVDAIVCWL